MNDRGPKSTGEERIGGGRTKDYNQRGRDLSSSYKRERMVKETEKEIRRGQLRSNCLSPPKKKRKII